MKQVVTFKMADTAVTGKIRLVTLFDLNQNIVEIICTKYHMLLSQIEVFGNIFDPYSL